MTKKNIAVVLFNLGGPDTQQAVKPFLFNLFNDRAIIDLIQPFRWLIAKIISTARNESAKANYQIMGGGSPILKFTLQQAAELESELNKIDHNINYKVFVCMRYWQPFTYEVVSKIKAGSYDEVILLPLYPHFSKTTTGSSLSLWHDTVKKLGLDIPTKTICCYPAHKDFIQAHSDFIKEVYNSILDKKSVRILFSAHGLPQKVINTGDPYQYHIEKTVSAILKALPYSNLDTVICYQSKVGPLKWLEPSTEHEIKRAANDNKAIIITPIAFVSEHVETLVELDHEYKNLAIALKVPGYYRVPALGIHQIFIKSLVDLCIRPHDQTKQCLQHHLCYESKITR